MVCDVIPEHYPLLTIPLYVTNILSILVIKTYSCWTQESSSRCSGCSRDEGQNIGLHTKQRRLQWIVLQ